MSNQEEALNQIVGVTGCSLDQAKFFLESANGDVAMAVATYFENAGQGEPSSSAEFPTSNVGQAQQQQQQQRQEMQAPVPQQPRGTYTLSGAPAEPLPAGWGASGSSSANSSRPASANRNPLRSNTGPRVTGFRDLASSSSGPSGGFGGGGGDSDDEDDSKDPANFYTGGAKSGLSVENPDDQRKKMGAHGDTIKKIFEQAKEGSASRFPGGGAAPEASGSSRIFTGNAHTLGSDETPSSFIPDPTPKNEDSEDDEELEVATRSLIFWQDGFSVEDSDLLKYEENQELLQAIQSGRAPLVLMKVQQDQRVELIVAKRLDEKWSRQPAPPAGPWSGSGNRLGSVSPYPVTSSSQPPRASSSTMPGSFTSSSSSVSTPSQSQPPQASTGQGFSSNVEFEVDQSQPTTRLQIRLRDGEKVVATFNHSHTVGDIRRYINASRPGESSTRYALQTTFPSKDLEDDQVSLKDAGLLGSVVVQRAL
ncbi:hypothetical protein JCM16303_001417 [Sporobolomyces ruberrimus]